MVSFVVGAKVQFRDPGAAWMTNDAANHRVAFLAVPGLGDDAQKTQHNGMHHLAFEYDSFDDLMSSFDRMRKGGVEPAFCLDHGLTISLYYRDPEGNFVELQSDNFSDWKLSSEFMRTSSDFAANPIGTFFNPARFTTNSSRGPISSLFRSPSGVALTCLTQFRTSGCRTPIARDSGIEKCVSLAWPESTMR